MKNSTYSRLLSEYLDGEIGLADKQLLEAALRSDAALQAEYAEKRRMGIALSTAIPQINVHPYRFRQRLAAALDQRGASFITPQRAFSSAMAIALVVVGITFGLFIYQERMIGHGTFISVGEAHSVSSRPSMPQHSATLVVEATAENFFNRMLIEARLGLLDPLIADQVVLQTGLLEGASCIDGQGLQMVVFPGQLPSNCRLNLSLAELQRLQIVADGLTGRNNPLALTSNGMLITQQEYLLTYPAGARLPVELKFQ